MKQFTQEDGSVHTYLGPKEKGHKFSKELKDNTRYTNAGYQNGQKKLKDGKAQSLSDTERAYRSGYLDARSDIGYAYALKTGKPVKQRKKKAKKEN